MNKALLAKKLGMTSIFVEDGLQVPVTVLEAGPCYVVQVKSKEKEGYDAVQLAYGTTREKLLNKPQKGHFNKAGLEYKRHLQEFKLENVTDYEVGQELTVEIFQEGDFVDVTGTSKGKGFAGVIKRHNQSLGRMSHGSKFHRAPGAMGGAATPGRILKGKALPGQMGAKTATIQNLQIVAVDAEKNLVLVKGSVPGANGQVVSIKNATKHN